MNNEKKCPYVKFDHKFYPDNTCSCKWSYCTHPGDFNDCDIYKLHQRTSEQLFKDLQVDHLGRIVLQQGVK